jgi:ATP-dependent RNA helicase DDX10/DBP4
MIIPKNLNQYYTIVEPEERVNVLYSFLKTHKMSKILVFVSSRKQVRYFTEVFKHLKLGMLFLDIHGKQKQGKRYSTFYTFGQKRNSVVLFATDLASRGIDFPAIDWVIQLDPPEDIAQYIHRVGRTARYKSDGNSVLFLGQKEINFMNELELRKIKVTKIKIAPNKINNITPVVRSLLSEHTELIEIAEKAISSYVKSINLMANKNVFNIKNIDLGKLALSYGLVSSPEMVVKSKKEVEEKIEEEDNKIAEIKNKKIEEEKNLVKENLINNNENKKKSKLFKLKEKIKLNKLMKQKEKNEENEIKLNEEEDNEFLTVKNEKEKKEEKKLLGEKRKKPETKEESEDEEENEFYKKVKNRLDKNKEIDKKKEKERIVIKHKEDKLKLKEKDYQKHGIEIEEEIPNKNNDYDDNDNGSEEIEDNSSDKSEEEKNKKSNKIKININHSTLKEKENAALEILKKKGIL